MERKIKNLEHLVEWLKTENCDLQHKLGYLLSIHPNISIGDKDFDINYHGNYYSVIERIPDNHHISTNNPYRIRYKPYNKEKIKRIMEECILDKFDEQIKGGIRKGRIGYRNKKDKTLDDYYDKVQLDNLLLDNKIPKPLLCIKDG
jgi:hypothetical protein